MAAGRGKAIVKAPGAIGAAGIDVAGLAGRARCAFRITAVYNTSRRDIPRVVGTSACNSYTAPARLAASSVATGSMGLA